VRLSALTLRRFYFPSLPISFFSFDLWVALCHSHSQLLHCHPWFKFPFLPTPTLCWSLICLSSRCCFPDDPYLFSLQYHWFVAVLIATGLACACIHCSNCAFQLWLWRRFHLIPCACLFPLFWCSGMSVFISFFYCPFFHPRSHAASLCLSMTPTAASISNPRFAEVVEFAIDSFIYSSCEFDSFIQSFSRFGWFHFWQLLPLWKLWGQVAASAAWVHSVATSKVQ
jgi:hypothetical protein